MSDAGSNSTGGSASRELEAIERQLHGAAQEELTRIADEIQGPLHARLGPGLVRHFVGRLGAGEHGRGEAEELAQRAWVVFWEALRRGRFDPSRARLSTFLYAVAQVVWMRAARERARERDRAGGHAQSRDQHGEQASPGPAEAAELAAVLELLRRVMAGGEGEFSPGERAVIRGVAQGRTDRELARDLGVSPSTAHERKKSVVERLARFLKGRGVEDPGFRD